MIRTTSMTRWALVLPLVLLGNAATAEVDEIIAQFPANDAEQANELFEALLEAGEDAIAGLCETLVPLGEGDDNAARYALTGLARYTSRPDAGRRDQDTVEEALLAGLERADDPEVRAYLLRQLQQCGSGSAVSGIAEFLDDDAVASHAILALDAIDAWRARRALVKALKTTDGDTQLQVLAALSDKGGWRVARVIRGRLEAQPEANEYVHLLSMLVAIAGDNAHPELIAAMDRQEPRIRQTALAHAAPLMDGRAARKWRKKVMQDGVSDTVKREIGELIAAYDAGN